MLEETRGPKEVIEKSSLALDDPGKRDKPDVELDQSVAGDVEPPTRCDKL